MRLIAAIIAVVFALLVLLGVAVSTLGPAKLLAIAILALAAALFV